MFWIKNITLKKSTNNWYNSKVIDVNQQSGERIINKKGILYTILILASDLVNNDSIPYTIFKPIHGYFYISKLIYCGINIYFLI